MIIRLAYTIDSDNRYKFRQFIINRLMGRPMYEDVCVVMGIRLDYFLYSPGVMPVSPLKNFEKNDGFAKFMRSATSQMGRSL